MPTDAQIGAAFRARQRQAGTGNAGKHKSPEHRAKLVESLKLARAARAKQAVRVGNMIPERKP